MNISHYLKKAAVYGAVALAFGSGFFATAAAQTGPFLTPTFPNGSEGNSFSTVPFTAGSGTARFQQIYDFQNLTIAGYSGPFLIQSIKFREDAGHQFGFSSSFANIQISFSTTTRPVDGLSGVFSENVGANDTPLINGSFRLGVSAATPFDDAGTPGAAIFLSTPFLYDPSQGNLLMDIHNFGGGGTTWGDPPFFGPAYVDAWNFAGDRVSSVSANSVGAVSGTASTLGLVTQFGMTPVPEPSTVALLTVGLVAFGFLARQRKTRKG